MKKLLFTIISAGVLLGACSNTQGEEEKQKNASSTEEEQVKEDKTFSSSSTDSNEQEKELEDSSTEPSSEDADSNNDLASEEDDSTQKEDIAETQAVEDQSNEFSVENYLNEHYAIERTHYSLDTWENEETGRTEYVVGILPDTEEFGQEIDTVFKEGNPYMDDDRTKKMFEVAEELLVDLPKVNDKVHIESVYWSASENEEFPVVLIQDRAQSTIE